jgi:phytoene/squalene synthetase
MYEGRSATADDGDGGHLVSSARRNPTLRSLVDAARTHGLTHRFLRRIVEALEADLDVVQYGRVRDVAQYGKDTMSNVLYLTLECLGVSICGRKNIASLP